MKIEKLPFAQLIKLDSDMMEVIVNEGVEMDVEMVNQYHAWLLENLTPPFGILVNKINGYTYTFEAQKILADLPEIKAMAVISYWQVSAQSTKSLKAIPRKIKWNMEIFNNRKEGLNWLNRELGKSKRGKYNQAESAAK